MAADTLTPQPQFATLDSAGGIPTPIAAVIPPLAAEFTLLQFDWTDFMGSVYIKNSGPVACWCQFQGCNPDASIAPLGIVANPVYLDIGEAMNLDDIMFSGIALILDSAGTALVQAVAVKRPGNSGEGL